MYRVNKKLLTATIVVSSSSIKSESNKLSVIPCRLIGDLHEWFNEVVAVPSQNLLKTLTGEKAGDI